MNSNAFARIEEIRNGTLGQLNAQTQQKLGQYFTPIKAAEIMTNLFSPPQNQKVNILDPGAGTGVLSCALIQRLFRENPDLQIHVTAVEIDLALHQPLRESYEEIAHISAEKFSFEIIGQDFIVYALNEANSFDLVILNPPYKKIPASSETSGVLERAGIPSPNLYASFLELGITLLTDSGQMVSITPRSFMNGTYFTKIRKRILSSSRISNVHIFHSRNDVFRDTGVLQEAIIVRWIKGSASTKTVQIDSSVNHTTQIQTYFAPYAQVVTDDFIFVPSHRDDAEVINQIAKYHHRLGNFSLRVSTGKVVDYRNRDQIDAVKSAESFPMIYSSNLKNGIVEHPTGPKGQWFTPSEATEKKMLIPAGTYVLLKRFSAKEENRRLVAAILTSLEPVALDNKLNFVHRNGSGIEHDEATQLAKWFNSDLADQYFRTFSGHTQVNAGDINNFPIPDLNSSLQDPSKRGR